MRKKTILFLALMLITTAVVSAQVTLDVKEGMSFGDLLKANWKGLCLVVWIGLETWLGQTGRLKSGSVLALILNLAGKALGKDELVKSKATNRALYMAKKSMKAVKILVVGVILSGIGLTASAQSLMDPVTVQTIKMVQYKHLRASDTLYNDNSGVMIARMALSTSGVKYNWSNADNKFAPHVFSRTGLGLTFDQFKLSPSGEVYKNWGFGAYILVPTSAKDDENYFSIMGDVSMPVKKLAALGLLKNTSLDFQIFYDVDKSREFKERVGAGIGTIVEFN